MARPRVALGALAVGLAAVGLLFGALSGLDPLVAAATGLALAFATVTLADLRFGLCLFVALAFLETLPTVLGPAVSPVKGAGLLLVLGWAVTSVTRQRARAASGAALSPGVLWLVAAFVGWAATSAIWAESSADVATDTSRYALNAVLFLVICSIVVTRRDLESVLWTFVIGAGLTAAVAIATGASSSADATDPTRAAGTIGDPNQLAAVLVGALPLAVALAADRERRARMRAAAAASAALALLGTLAAASRGGLLALAAVLITAVLIGGRWRSAALPVAVLVVVSSVVYFGALAPAALRDRLTTGNDGSGRTDLWRVASRIIEDRPMLGVGAGNFELAAVRYVLRPGELTRADTIVSAPRPVHNTYLQVLAELGLVGGLMLFALIGYVLRCGMQAARAFTARGDRPMELLSRAWIAGLAGMLVADFFLSAQFSKQLWFMLALGPCLRSVARVPVEARVPARIRAHAGRLAPRPASAPARL